MDSSASLAVLVGVPLVDVQHPVVLIQLIIADLQRLDTVCREHAESHRGSLQIGTR